MSGTAVVIPLYNHGSTIAATVERLRPYDLPIYIVDDGSDTATQATLRALYQRHPELRGLRLDGRRLAPRVEPCLRDAVVKRHGEVEAS